MGTASLTSRLYQARVATIALDQAIRDNGGQTRLWVFSSLAYECKSAGEMTRYYEGGTNVDFLADVARKYPGWDFIIITDAYVSGVPADWVKHRARTTVVLLDGRKEQAAVLGDRVFEVHDVSRLPILVGQVARKYVADNQI